MVEVASFISIYHKKRKEYYRLKEWGGAPLGMTGTPCLADCVTASPVFKGWAFLMVVPEFLSSGQCWESPSWLSTPGWAQRGKT